MLRLVPSVPLLVEGLWSALYVAGLISALAGHSGIAVTLVLVRLLVGMLQFTGGWLLFSARPPGDLVAKIAFLASAVLTTLETGLRLVPSNADPTYRWPLVALYWVYAMSMIWVVRKAVPAEQ